MREGVGGAPAAFRLAPWHKPSGWRPRGGGRRSHRAGTWPARGWSSRARGGCASARGAGVAAARRWLRRASCGILVGARGVPRARVGARRGCDDGAAWARRVDTAEEREALLVREQIGALVPLLPLQVVSGMLGGELGMRQVPDGAARAAQLGRILAERAGTEGARVADVRRALGVFRAYAQECMGVLPGHEDDALFPMSSALAHEIIHWESERARASSKGSQGGRRAAGRHGLPTRRPVVPRVVPVVS